MCREEIAAAVNDFGNRWCKREYVEPSALKRWKLGIFKIIDQRIEFILKIISSSHPSPLTLEVVGAPQMTLQQYLSTLPCGPLPSGNLQTPFPSIP